MQFEADKFFLDNEEEIRSLEGGISWMFAQRALSKVNIDCSDCHVLEVGPKHGLHTLGIDLHQPKSITCVEGPNKVRSLARRVHEVRDTQWTLLKTEDLELHYQDFDKFISHKKFGLLFYCGVMYHNINQMHQLQKLYELASEDAYMVFESSTSSNVDLLDKNVIEVHYPPYSSYRNEVRTIVFHPTKLACKSMLEIAGWDIIETSDEYDDLSHEHRINILCKKGFQRKNPHLTDENLDVETYFF